MSDRIRQLEDALAILQSSVTRDLHPLLMQDLLKIKSGLELHSAAHLQGRVAHSDDGGEQGDEESQYIDAFGTLAVRDDGAAMFYGRSAGSEVRVPPILCVLAADFHLLTELASGTSLVSVTSSLASTLSSMPPRHRTRMKNLDSRRPPRRTHRCRARWPG